MQFEQIQHLRQHVALIQSQRDEARTELTQFRAVRAVAESLAEAVALRSELAAARRDGASTMRRA